jgi:hypothetical protein
MSRRTLYCHRGLYEEAAEISHCCIYGHPEVFEADYNLALADIVQQRWEAALAILQQATPAVES